MMMTRTTFKDDNNDVDYYHHLDCGFDNAGHSV